MNKEEQNKSHSFVSSSFTLIGKKYWAELLRKRKPE